jgi:hypothetical protein
MDGDSRGLKLKLRLKWRGIQEAEIEVDVDVAKSKDQKDHRIKGSEEGAHATDGGHKRNQRERRALQEGGKHTQGGTI